MDACALQGRRRGAHRYRRWGSRPDLEWLAGHPAAHQVGQAQGAGDRRQPPVLGDADLPTVSEAGVPGFQSGSWQGLLAPAGTPPDIVAKLNDAVVKVLNEPEMKQRLADQGAEVVANTPEEFAVFIREDTAKWAKIVKDSGIKVE